MWKNMPEETTKSIKSGCFWRMTELVKRGAVFHCKSCFTVCILRPCTLLLCQKKKMNTGIKNSCATVFGKGVHF